MLPLDSFFAKNASPVLALVKVLDELRPYLKSDGGDCKISDIQDSVVKLELIGACSSCSASSVTMKMGIETPNRNGASVVPPSLCRAMGHQGRRLRSASLRFQRLSP